MTRAWLRISLICLAAGLLLAVPTPLDAGGAPGQQKPDKKPGPHVAQPSPQRCICKVKAPRRLRASAGSHRLRKAPSLTGESPAWNRRAREAALLRRIMLAQLPLLMPEPRPRHLDEWRIRLIDGNTFAYGAERIRIKGIDTPEASETGGFEASQRLDLLLREGPVTIIPQALDKYGRTLADVFVNDQNVAELLKDEGYAKPR